MSLIIDGTDLETLGLVVRGLSDVRQWRATPQFEWPTAEIPGRHGPTVLGTHPTVRARNLSIPCAVKPASDYASTRAAVREVASRLTPHDDSDRVVEFNDEEGAKHFLARLANVEGRNVGPQFVNGRVDLSINLVAHDPKYFDESTNTVSLGTTASDVPLGTAPVWPTITMPAATVEYLDSGGTVVDSLTLSGSNGPYTVDFDRQTITNTNGNPEPEAFDSGFFFRLDPADGNEPSDVWPQLRLTSGSGSVDYRRAWWL